MAEWTKVGNKYEYRAYLLCGVVAPAPEGAFSWYITGGADEHRLTAISAPMSLGHAQISAESALREVWLAFGDAFYRPLVWRDGEPGGAVRRIASLDRWRLEAASTGWWDIALCDDLGKASRHEVVERAADLTTAMRDAEAYLRDRLGARFRSTLQSEDRNS